MTRTADAPPGRSFADEAFAATAGAYANASGGWELAIRSAIEGLFAFLADHPAQTKACMVAGGGEALARRDRTIDRFVELLRPGFAAGATRQPPVIAEAIGGGIYELVRSHALEQRLEELPSAVPAATIVALTPFMGADGANELASSTSVRPR